MSPFSRASGLLRKLSRSNRGVHSSSFADLYRTSVGNALVQPGDIVKGRVVGRRRPRGSLSRFYIVDFGLKNEAPFSAKEIPASSATGDEVTLPLMGLEDDFNEPVFDHERRAELPSIMAERYALLTKARERDVQLVHGRFAGFKKGGASIKVLGTDAFSPRHHVVAIDRPVLGSFAPFLIMSVSIDKSNTGSRPMLDINPIVSSYGGFLFSLTSLIGFDDAWERSGGGSPKERLSYLRLLTRLLSQKNTAVRRILPKQADRLRRSRSQHEYGRARKVEPNSQDAAWLNDLPQSRWASSGAPDRPESSTSWSRFRGPPNAQSSTGGQQRTKSSNFQRGRGSQSRYHPGKASDGSDKPPRKD